MPPRLTRLVQTPGICLIGSRHWSAPWEYASSAQVFEPTQRNRSLRSAWSVCSYVLTIAMWIANAGHAHPPRLYSDLAEEHRALESRLLFP
eukprot:2268812-Pyramimonas_sp.AAC.1